jgi:hypothetical protein
MWGEKVYVPAIMGASGITKEQAKTCLYYAVATHLLPDELDRMPILAVIGPLGTGKSDLLTQLSTMVNEPKVIAAESIPTLRDNLHKTVTAIIDEGDDVYEKYLIQRYDKETSNITYKRNYGGSFWKTVRANIFGATIIARRTPFRDAATTSRSITIKTLDNPGDYRIKYFRTASSKISDIASEVSLEEETSERIRNNWMPLRAVAEYIEDTEWLDYSNEEIKKDTRVLRGSQNYEPEKALLIVIRENMTDEDFSASNDVELSKIRNELKTVFDIHMKNAQIEAMCRNFRFLIKVHRGYPRVKANVELLKRLLKESKI